MTSHPALKAFRKEHEDILYLADRMRDARRRMFGRSHVEDALREAIAFSAGPLQDHLADEDATLLAVMHEHLADAHPDIIESDMHRRQRLRDDIKRMRQAVETGSDERAALKEMEDCLRDYVAYEENVLLPWAKANLGDILLREVDARYAGRFEEEPATPTVDLEAFVAA
jgi:hemerythrin-like domain-containing protein